MFNTLRRFLRNQSPRPNPAWSDAAPRLMGGGRVLDVLWDDLRLAWVWSFHEGGRKRAEGIMRYDPTRSEVIDGREMPVYLRAGDERRAKELAQEEAALKGYARGSYRVSVRTSKFI